MARIVTGPHDAHRQDPHRPDDSCNSAVRWNGSRWLGSASVHAATDAFWSDVLTAGYHGYTDGYATVNGSVGVKWRSGAITTTVKVNNVFNQTVHQHIFGDRRCCMNTRCGWGGVARTSRDPPQEPHYGDEVEGSSQV